MDSPPGFKVNGQLEDFMMPGGQCVNDGWDQDEVSPIGFIADGRLVGVTPRRVSDPCTSPQLSKVVVEHRPLRGGPRLACRRPLLAFASPTGGLQEPVPRHYLWPLYFSSVKQGVIELRPHLGVLRVACGASSSPCLRLYVLLLS